MASETAKEFAWNCFLEFVFEVAKIDKSKFDNDAEYQEHVSKTPNNKCYMCKWKGIFFLRLEWLIKDPEPEFEILDLLLEQCECENISYLKYKKLLRDICKMVVVDHGDYHAKTINLEDLYNWLDTNTRN